MDFFDIIFSCKGKSLLKKMSNYFQCVLKRLFIIVMVLFLFSTCTFFSSKSKCERIIEKDKMVDVMTDIYLLEAYIQITSRSRSSIRDSVDYLYAGLFDKHNITKETYDKAFECYSLDRELMLGISEEVFNTISIIESQKQDDETVADDEPALKEIPLPDDSRKAY